MVGREGRRGGFLDGLAAVRLLADDGFGNLVVIGEAGRLPNDGRGSGDITLDGIPAPSEKPRDACIKKEKDHLFGHRQQPYKRTLRMFAVSHALKYLLKTHTRISMHVCMYLRM